jgi:hypothetical protein
MLNSNDDRMQSNVLNSNDDRIQSNVLAVSFPTALAALLNRSRARLRAVVEGPFTRGQSTKGGR